jgi:hypothetical protein
MSEVVIENGQEFVELDEGRFGLGLQLPPVRTMIYPSLATFTPVLSMNEIRNVIESSEFEFGKDWFGEDWNTNQNGYGSCAAYAASSALAKARYLGGQDRVDLSGDYLYSLVNGGRDSGSMLDENMRAIMSKGVCKRETVPLGGIYRNKYDTAKADREALRFRAHEAYACPDEQSVATALALKMPVVIAIHVGRNWSRQDGDFLIGDSGPGNHSENLDDIRYNTRAGRFEFREQSSHKRPCFWVSWDKHLKQPSRYHQFYAVPSAIQDPHGDKPFAESQGDEDTPVAAPKLTITTSAGCVWCTRWKQTEQPKVEEAGYELHEGSIPGSGVPRFMLEVGDRELIKVGFWSFDEIERAVANLR